MGERWKEKTKSQQRAAQEQINNGSIVIARQPSERIVVVVVRWRKEEEGGRKRERRACVLLYGIYIKPSGRCCCCCCIKKRRFGAERGLCWHQQQDRRHAQKKRLAISEGETLSLSASLSLFNIMIKCYMTTTTTRRTMMLVCALPLGPSINSRTNEQCTHTPTTFISWIIIKLKCRLTCESLDV